MSRLQRDLPTFDTTSASYAPSSSHPKHASSSTTGVLLEAFERHDLAYALAFTFSRWLLLVNVAAFCESNAKLSEWCPFYFIE